MAKKKSNTQDKRSVLNRLLSFFGIGLKNKEIIPSKKTIDPNTGESRLKAVKFPSSIEKYYEYWLSNMDTYDSLGDRISRYRDLEFMVRNSGIMHRACQLYADETILPDENNEIFKITAKEKGVEKYIQDFFNTVGVTKTYLEECAWDLSLYADHFWVHSIDLKKGVTEIIPIEVTEVENRIEFNALRAAKDFHKNQVLTGLRSKHAQLDNIYQMINNARNKQDYSTFFKNYLFGFSIINSDIALAPWEVSHFRRFSTKSEFAPFGRPIFINSISLYRIFKAGQNLVAMLRASKLPKEIYKIKTSTGMSEVERWNKINEARQEFMNFVSLQNGLEDIGVGSSIWTDQELLEYELIENRTNIDDIADIKMLMEDLITSTGIPPSYLIQSDRVFGESGKALIQQSKPFSRQVYRNQTAILEQLIRLVKIHWTINGDYDPDTTDFEISLNFPTIEESTDRVRLKSDQLRLATDILSNLGDTLGLERGEALPKEIVKDIFMKYGFFNTSDLDSWFKTFEQSRVKNNEEDTSNNDFYEKTRNKVHNRLTEQVFRSVYMDSKKRLNFNEGVSNQRHYVTSFINSPLDKQMYEALKKDNPPKDQQLRS
jgi:hypothetical protein